jgi:hypothetical protein
MLVKSVAGLRLLDLRAPLERAFGHFEAEAGVIIFDSIPMVAHWDEVPSLGTGNRDAANSAASSRQGAAAAVNTRCDSVSASLDATPFPRPVRKPDEWQRAWIVEKYFLDR